MMFHILLKLSRYLVVPFIFVYYFFLLFASISKKFRQNQKCPIGAHFSDLMYTLVDVVDNVLAYMIYLSSLYAYNINIRFVSIFPFVQFFFSLWLQNSHRQMIELFPCSLIHIYFINLFQMLYYIKPIKLCKQQPICQCVLCIYRWTLSLQQCE